MRRWIAVALLAGTAAQAQSARLLMRYRLDPALHYQTAQTEHFLLHYPDELAPLAAHLAPIAEQAFARIAHQLPPPAGLTDVVLFPRSDRPATFTFVYPHRQIFFDVALPDPSVGSNDYGDWHEWLFTHELSHVAHLEARGGVYGPLSLMLGSWIRPNLITPLWMREGVAVELETSLTGAGRGESSTWRMMIRAADADGTFEDPTFASPVRATVTDSSLWPASLSSYLFGYVAVHHLAARIPLDRLARETGSSLPYVLGPALGQAGFASVDDLWKSALGEARARARAEAQALAERPFTPLEYLTDTGYYWFGPIVSPDGRWLVATHEGYAREPMMMRLRIDGDRAGAPEPLFGRSTGYSASFSRSGHHLVYDQSSRTDRHYLVSELEVFDWDRGEVVVRTLGQHARDPDVHPDGEHVVFVANRDGANRLLLTDLTFENTRELLGDVGYRRISAPRYSPDGRRLAVNVHGARGGEEIWLVEDGQGRPLVADGAQNRSPSWSPDGKWILFASDRSGVFDIYAIDPDSKQTFRLSHVLGGLFFPVVDPAQRWVYVVSYRGKGDDLARFRYQPEQWEKVDPLPPAPQPAPEPAPVPLKAQPYRALPHLAPQYVVPSALIRPDGLQLGAAIGAVDPLYFHRYLLELRYDTATRLPVGRLSYFNGAYPIAFNLDVSHDAYRIATGERLRQLGGTLTAEVPMSEHGVHVNFRPGLVARLTDFRGRALRWGAAAGVRYDTEFWQRGQSFPEEGTYADVRVVQYTSRLVSLEATLRWNVALTDRRQALHLSFEAGTYVLGADQPDAFFTAGGRASFPFSLTSGFTLYGYPPNTFLSPTLLVAGAHYTFQLADLQRGLSVAPLYLGRLSAALRAQAANLGDLPPATVPASVGIELHQELVLGYFVGLRVQLGLYQRLDGGGGPQFLLALVQEGEGA